ncbi:MAG TPA: DHH family phosphoesterase [Spirochaetota bacterium]
MERLRVREDDADGAYTISRLFGLTDIGGRLLSARGIKDPHQAGTFLYPRLSAFHSPFLILSMREAVARVRSAIKKHETIGIFSDSDLDGLTALAITVQFLEGASLKVVHRYPVGDETYGLTADVIDEFANAGVSLVITLDCGIRDCDEVAHARTRGIDCIICDHHEPGEELPDGIVIDPKVGDKYPFRELAGASVAMKLCHALAISYLPMFSRRYAIATTDDESGACEIRFIENGVRIEILSGDAVTKENFPPDIHTLFHYNMKSLPDWMNDVCGEIQPYENLVASAGLIVSPGVRETLCRALSLPPHYPASVADCAEEFFFDVSCIRPKKIQKLFARWLPLAAIGTIADIVPLTGENRTIVEKGLSLFLKCDLPAIKLLYDEFGLCDATAVAWKIAPLLNAPGRLGKTELTAEFLLGKDDISVTGLIRKIKKLNDERRKMMKESFDLFVKEIDEGGHRAAENITYIRSPKVGEGFTGLIAGRIAEKTGKPAIVVSEMEGRGILKGSGRAPDGIDLLSFAEPFADDFDRFGGHAQAFGFSACAEMIDLIIKKIDVSMNGVALRKKEVVADLVINSPGELVSFFSKDYPRLAPFGHGNDVPLFFTPSLFVGGCTPFGNDKNHGKYQLSGGVSAIGWDMFEHMDRLSGGSCNLLYRIEEDKYSGRMRLVFEQIEAAAAFADGRSN